MTHYQFGTSNNEYDDIEKCITSLLQVQSARSGTFPQLRST
jgi:hypothetical protein